MKLKTIEIKFMQISQEQYNKLQKHLQEYFYKGNFHCTTKPLSLMRWLIKLITPPGGIILDPFAGSGSTCVAAEQLGFQWIGIEMEHEYVEISRLRIEYARKQKSNKQLELIHVE